MVRYTLKQLSYFSAVAEHGGIAQAARSLNISQPAVAFALDRLEELIGVRLLSRQHARGTELTPEGREVLALARALLSSAETTGNAFQSIAAEVTGHLRLGCFPTLSALYVPGLIHSVRARHPGITLQVIEGGQQELAAAVIDQSVDVALLYDLSLDESHLGIRRVDSLSPYVLLAETHPLAAENTVRLADLAGDPYVMFEWPGTREYIEAALRQVDVELEVAFSTGSIELVRSAVANGLGYSILYVRPLTDVAYDGRRIVCRPVADALPDLDIALAWPLAAETSALREFFLTAGEAYFLGESRESAVARH